MGASQEPETQEQQEVTTQDSESQSQPTPQTATQQPQATDNSRYVSLLEATLREQNQTLEQLRQQNQAIASQGNQPPTNLIDPEAEKVAFYNDPVGIIRREIKASVEPLLGFVQQFRGQTQYESLKNRFKADPRFATMWDSAIENAVDSVMLSGKVDINDINMQSAVVQAIGLKAAGLLPGAQAAPGNTAQAQVVGQPFQNNQQQPQTQQPVITPAHLRPSAPRTPAQANQNKRRDLTENERRLAREQNLTDEQYLEWLEMPASGIIGSKIGRPQEAGK